jgi:hypothetical protein
MSRAPYVDAAAYSKGGFFIGKPMTEETGAAAPTDERAANSAPAESEQATKTTEQSVQPDAAQETAETEQPDTESPQEESEPDDKPKKLSRSERQRRRLRALATEIETLRAQLAEKGSQTAEAPKEEDFNGDYVRWQAALAAHEAAQAVKQEFQSRDKQTREQQLQDRQREAAAEFFERAEELKATITDFDEVFEVFSNNGGKFEPHVIEELQLSEHGPMLAYQLAKNPRLASELNAMSARDAAREIGRLEAKVSLPQPRKQTQAPKPLTTPTGAAAAPRTPEDAAKAGDMEAYVKLREEQEKARRR